MAGDAVVTIRRHFKRPDPALVKALTGYPTGYFVDIQNRRGALDAAIRPVFPCRPFVGTAVTVKTVPDDNLAPYLSLGVLQSGDVLVIATGGWTGSAVIGDLSAGLFRNAGAVAVVTDGMARDVKGLAEVGIPVFAQGLTPNSPQKNGPGEIGGEVAIGGVVVRSGDILVGDADGVVVLPQGRFADAVAALEGIKAKEAKIEKEIAAGVTQSEWIREYLAGERVSYLD